MDKNQEDLEISKDARILLNSPKGTCVHVELKKEMYLHQYDSPLSQGQYNGGFVLRDVQQASKPGFPVKEIIGYYVGEADSFNVCCNSLKLSKLYVVINPFDDEYSFGGIFLRLGEIRSFKQIGSIDDLIIKWRKP
jgi:hypothetical protein